MGFPIKDVVASCYFYKLNTQWVAYLKVGDNVYDADSFGDFGSNGCVHYIAKRVEFSDLPEEAKDFFVDKLSDMGIPLNARGLFKLPELLKIEERGMYVIMRKRTRMRHNNYRIYCGETGVHKTETIKAARQWCDANLEDN